MEPLLCFFCFGRAAECQDGETGQKSGPAVGPVPMACFELSPAFAPAFISSTFFS